MYISEFKYIERKFICAMTNYNIFYTLHYKKFCTITCTPMHPILDNSKNCSLPYCIFKTS